MTLSTAQSRTNSSYGKEKGFYFKLVEEVTGCCRQKDEQGLKSPVNWFSFFSSEHHAGCQQFGE